MKKELSGQKEKINTIQKSNGLNKPEMSYPILINNCFLNIIIGTGPH